jgi:sugar-specific transcriptional regulator TrmB
MTEPLTASHFLAQLGFTDTEALVYCELLSNPGATGYAVAKALRKSQANVYTALGSLSVKGAVIFDDSDVRAYRALLPSELLPRLSREFQARCAAAEAALATVARAKSDDHIYQFGNEAQVYERAVKMCERAKDSIAVGAFPRPFERLRDSFTAALDRGVGVAGVTFRPEDSLPGATLVFAVKAQRASSWPRATNWPRDQLTLVVDAEEALVALFDRETHAVLTALYTSSTYLASMLHAALLDATILNLEHPDVLDSSVNKRLFGRIPSGFLRLAGRPDEG